MSTHIAQARRVSAEVAEVFGGQVMSITVDEAKRKEDYLTWVSEGRERGFKPGFPAAKYKEQYGEWPPRQWASEAGVEQSKKDARPSSAPSGRCQSCGQVLPEAAKKNGSQSEHHFPENSGQSQIPF